MEHCEPIEVDPEDVTAFQVGEEIFGRRIERIDAERRLFWVREPSRWYRIKRWFRVLWWRVST